MDYTDKISDRLDHPEHVPAHLAHLIPDDVQRVQRILEFPVSGRVLDVGCSDGAITKRIARTWLVAVMGCDTRPSLPQAESNYERGGRWSAWFERWDIRQPCGNADPFDANYACEVLEHLTDADVHKALEHILAVLKPGGDLIVTVPNRHPHDLYEVGCRSRWAWPDHRSSWSVTKLHALIGYRFTHLHMVPLYEGELPSESIWVIAHATGKR